MQTQLHQRRQTRAQALPALEANGFHDDSPLSTLLGIGVMALICMAGIGFKALLLS